MQIKAKIDRFLNDGDKKDILVKGMSFLIFRLGGMLAGYVLVLLISRLFGAGVNGLVSLSFMLFILTGIVARLGIDINMVRFYADDENYASNQGLIYRLMGRSFLMAVLLCAGLYLAGNLIVLQLFKKPAFMPYFLWTLPAIPFWAVTLLSSGFLRARKKNNWFAFLNNPGRFLFTLVFFGVFLIFSKDPLIVVQAHLCGVFLLSLIGVGTVLRTYKNFSIKHGFPTGRFVKDSIPMMLSSTILVLLGWMDTFVLGVYVTDAEIGIYSVALKIATLTSFSLQAINSILAPKIARNYLKGDVDQTKNLIEFSTKLNFFLTLFVVGLILVFNQFVLGMFGSEFQSGALTLIVLCVGQLISSLAGSVGTILQMTGYQKVYQNIVLVALVVNLLLNFILTPIYGIKGAAIATVVSIATWNIMGSVFLRKRESIITYYKFW